MRVGGEKNASVKPEDGYGKVNLQAFQKVPKEKIPANGLKDGAILTAATPDGDMAPMRVSRDQRKYRRHGYEPSHGGKNSRLQRQSRRHKTATAAPGGAAGQARGTRKEINLQRT